MSEASGCFQDPSELDDLLELAPGSQQAPAAGGEIKTSEPQRCKQTREQIDSQGCVSPTAAEGCLSSSASALKADASSGLECKDSGSMQPVVSNDIGQHLEREWKLLLEHARRVDTEIALMQEKSVGIKMVEYPNTYNTICSAARSIYMTLLEEAKEAFSPAEHLVAIDERQMLSDLGPACAWLQSPAYRKDHFSPGYDTSSGKYVQGWQERFSPIRIWSWLDANLGSGKGQVLAKQQLVHLLRHQLRLSDQQPEFRNDGRLVLSRGAYATKNFRGEWEYHYGCQDDFMAYMLSLQRLAALSGHQETETALKAILARSRYELFQSHRPPCKFQVGAIEVVFQTRKIVLTIDKDFAVSLLEFLSRYA